MVPWIAVRSVVRRATCLSGCRRNYLVAAFSALAAAVGGTPAWAFNPVPLADVGPDTHVAAAALPAGGYLLVWQDTRRSDSRLTAQRFTAAGQPAAPAKLLDVGAAPGSLAVASVAVGKTGAWAVFWVQATDPDEIGIGAAFFDARDRLKHRIIYDDPIPDPGELRISHSPHAIALAGGGYVVAVEVGTQDDPAGDPLQPDRSDVYVMKLDAAGRRLGRAVRVSQAAQGFQRLTGCGASGDHVVVSWDSVPAGPETSAVRARFLDRNLVPRGPEVHVAEPDGSAAGVGHSRLAVGPDGRALLVWEGTETAPVGESAGRGIRMRAYGPSGKPVGTEHAADPGTPGDHVGPDAGLASDGTVWVGWSTVSTAGSFESVISLRPFDLAGEATGDAEDVAATLGDGPFLTGGREGALVTWRTGPSSATLEGFVVGPAGGQSGPPSASFAIEGTER
jgi:hypothetical protein